MPICQQPPMSPHYNFKRPQILYPGKAYITWPWLLLPLYFIQNSPSTLSLLCFSPSCYSRTLHCLFPLSEMLLFLIFAYVILWPTPYFPSNSPPIKVCQHRIPDLSIYELYIKLKRIKLILLKVQFLSSHFICISIGKFKRRNRDIEITRHILILEMLSMLKELNYKWRI